MRPWISALRPTASLFLAFVPFLGDASAQEQAANAIVDRAVPLRSIEPGDDDFSDLMPLRSEIGAARVVVLGEGTHSEGTTSRVKARLARFLHEYMGFDVLAWETGLVQVHGMNRALRNHEHPMSDAASYLMSGGWAAEEGIRPLLEYARTSWRSMRPLEMAGFDAGRPKKAASHFRAYLSELFIRAPEIALADDEWELVDRLLTRAYGFRSSTSVESVAREAERNVLEELLEKLRGARERPMPGVSQLQRSWAERFVLDALRSDHLHTLSGLEWNEARDAYMADTVLWLLDEAFRGRKVIIWAATSHFIRNSDRIRNEEDRDAYASAWQAGNELASTLGADLYTIAVTAYSGRIGDVFRNREPAVSELEPAPPGSFETLAHAAGHPYAFFDLRGAPGDHWLSGTYVSVALGRLVNEARWRDVVDAFLFIDEAEPIRYVGP